MTRLSADEALADRRVDVAKMARDVRSPSPAKPALARGEMAIQHPLKVIGMHTLTAKDFIL